VLSCRRAVEVARYELAAELRSGGPARYRYADPRYAKEVAAAVQAAGPSLTGLSGVSPIIAAAVTADVRDVFRFPG
jgi:hypothetical protein